MASTLQQAKLPLSCHSECAANWGGSHLCAGSKGSGGCNGDSGGPLACKVGGKWFLHGAVSFGKRNCPTNVHTVFTRITSYYNWIAEKTGEVFVICLAVLRVLRQAPSLQMQELCKTLLIFFSCVVIRGCPRRSKFVLTSTISTNTCFMPISLVNNKCRPWDKLQLLL